MRQADRENLVRTNRSIRHIVDYVVKTILFGIPENLIKATLRLPRHLSETLPCRLVTLHCRKAFHGPQRVVPKRLDLHRLPDPWRHYPVADLRSEEHTSELQSRLQLV